MSRYRRSAFWLSAVLLAGVAFASSGMMLPLAASASSTSGVCGERPRLDPDNFPASPKVDNQFTPLVPGMQYTLDGFVKDDLGVHHPHRIVTNITNLTKKIGGVNTIVVYDLDYQDGVLTESELFFQAQDAQGTVWLIGEYPEEWNNGALLGAPRTWVTGVQSAHAGIAMLAQPHVGSPTYIQGLARPVGFFDCATVFATGQSVCVPVRCFNHVLVTDEFSPLDPAGGHQRKYYAPGVGTINVTAVSGVDPETLQLTKFGKLCEDAFEKVIKNALKQDARGYSVAPTPYSATTPARATLAARTC